MKKYLLGLVAIGFAAGFSAFNMPAKKFDTTRVVFTGNTQDQLEVQDPSKWHVITAPNCQDGELKACTFVIDNQYLTTGQTPNRIVNSVSISASGNATDGYKPISTSVGLQLPEYKD
jgi:hypothetical protein